MNTTIRYSKNDDTDGIVWWSFQREAEADVFHNQDKVCDNSLVDDLNKFWCSRSAVKQRCKRNMNDNFQLEQSSQIVRDQGYEKYYYKLLRL